MIKDVLTAKSIITTENGEKWELSYFIRTFFSVSGETFALRVDKREENGGRLLDTETSPAFSDNYDYILNMAEAFCKGQVMPRVLIEMCDEWVS